MQFSTIIVKAVAVLAFAAPAFAAPSPDPEVAAILDSGLPLDELSPPVAAKDTTEDLASVLEARQNTKACAATRVACDNCKANPVLRPGGNPCYTKFHNACVACGGAAAGCRC